MVPRLADRLEKNVSRPPVLNFVETVLAESHVRRIQYLYVLQTIGVAVISPVIIAVIIIGVAHIVVNAHHVFENSNVKNDTGHTVVSDRDHVYEVVEMPARRIE